MKNDFNYQNFPPRLNLGCGYDLRNNYLNVDMHSYHSPDLVADVTQLWSLPENYYDEILASDILEHLPRTSTRGVLVHWNRLLKINGILRLRVPSLLHLARLMQLTESQTLERQEILMQCLFGTQAYSGDFHLTSFTELILENYLRQAGYQLKQLTVKDEWLFDVEAVKERHRVPRDVNDFSDLLTISLNSEFVDASYLEILGRPADDGGKAFYIQKLEAGDLTREQFHAKLLTSEEYSRKQTVKAIS